MWRSWATMASILSGSCSSLQNPGRAGLPGLRGTELRDRARGALAFDEVDQGDAAAVAFHERPPHYLVLEVVLALREHIGPKSLDEPDRRVLGEEHDGAHTREAAEDT